jgi:hypothetical protein
VLSRARRVLISEVKAPIIVYLAMFSGPRRPRVLGDLGEVGDSLLSLVL